MIYSIKQERPGIGRVKYTAKQIIEKHKSKVLELAFENGKTDLDTKEDYYEFLQSKN